MTKGQVQQFVFLIVSMLVLASSVLAQTPGEARDAEIEALRDVDAMLSARIDALETPAAPDPAPDPSPTPDPAPVPDPAPTPQPTPTPGADLWQYGVGFMAYWGGEDPLINVLALNVTEEAWPADVFDRATQTFLRLPDGQSDLNIGLIRAGARFDPAYYAGDYIIDWEGEGRVGTTLAGAGSQVSEGPNRIRETYDGSRAGWASAVIRDIGAGGLSNIRIYRAEHEAALKAGKIFNPDFVRNVARYDIVRTMDWNAPGAVTRADQIADIGAQFWGGAIVPLEAQFKLAEEAGVALWINAPSRLAAPEGLNARLADIPAQLDRYALIATQFDTVAASPEWDAYAARLVAAMEATGYPIDRPFYLELANETWNWGGPFSYATEWYWGLTGALAEKTGKSYPGNPSRGAYGYFSARLAEAFAKALDAAGRGAQPWTLVIGAQTSWDAQTIGPLEGVTDYAGGNFKQAMARYGVATTGYYRGAFHDAGGALFGSSVKGEAAWRAEWLRRFEADPAALAQYLSDFMIDPVPRRQNIAWVVAQSQRHAEIAAQYGARYLGQYEGSSHDTLDKELAKNARALAFYKDWQRGPRSAALIRLQAEQMRAAFPDGVVLSNYQHWSNDGVSPKGPWIFNTLWGAETDAEAAMAEAVGE